MPDLVPFLAAALVVVVVPGADMALVTRNTTAGGHMAGFRTIAGILTGVCFHAMAAVFGLSAIVAASATAFQTVKYIGAAYLVVVGARSLLSARTSRTSRALSAPTDLRARRSSFVEGLVTNVFNPKLAVFFLSLMPQFVVESSPALPQLVLLSLAFLAVGALWLAVFVTAIDRVGAAIQRPSIARAIDAVFGTILVGLGLRLALLNNS